MNKPAFVFAPRELLATLNDVLYFLAEEKWLIDVKCVFSSAGDSSQEKTTVLSLGSSIKTLEPNRVYAHTSIFEYSPIDALSFYPIFDRLRMDDKNPIYTQLLDEFLIARYNHLSKHQKKRYAKLIYLLKKGKTASRIMHFLMFLNQRMGIYPSTENRRDITVINVYGISSNQLRQNELKSVIKQKRTQAAKLRAESDKLDGEVKELFQKIHELKRRAQDEEKT